MDSKRNRAELLLSNIGYNPSCFVWSSCEQMPTATQPNTASTHPASSRLSIVRSDMADVLMQKPDTAAASKHPSRHQTTKDASSKLSLHRSVPPVHELTSYNIGYKPSSEIIRYQKSAPAPTNMTYLPSAQEKLQPNRKLMAKVIGFDSTTFEQTLKSAAFPTEESEANFTRYNNAFVTGRSPRGLRSNTWKEWEMSQSEILKGHSLPATPRLLRGGNSKNYGVRRQISSSNQLELSPDFKTESPTRKSAIHFNTPAADVTSQFHLVTPAEDDMLDQDGKNNDRNETVSKEQHRSNSFVSPFSNESFDSAKVAVTNRLMARDRQRDAPWVYCYKIKRDRLKLSQLLSKKGADDPKIDDLLPTF